MPKFYLCSIGFSGSVSHGIIASNGLENGSFDRLHSTVCAPISPFTDATSHAMSSTVSQNLSTTLRFASMSGQYNQAAHADLSHSLNQFNFGVQGQGITSFHPHSLPDFHNGTTNGTPCESSNLMSAMSFNVNMRSTEETNNRFLQKVGSGTLNQYNNGEHLNFMYSLFSSVANVKYIEFYQCDFLILLFSSSISLFIRRFFNSYWSFWNWKFPS